MSRVYESGKSIVIGLVIAAVVVVGGAAAYIATDGFGMSDAGDTLSKNSSKDETNDKSEVAKDTPLAQANDIDTLLEEATLGKARIKCTFTHEGAFNTMYAKGVASLRFDIDSPEAGFIHLIKQDDVIYSWSKDSRDGVIIPSDDGIDSEKGPTAADIEKLKSQEDRPADLRCERFDASDSLFTPPVEVQFMNMPFM